MTDARIPERYLNDRRILKLTDTERSSYFMAAVWSVSNRTDGAFDEGDLNLIPTFNRSAIPTLLAVGLWARTAEGYADTEFLRVNTSRDDLLVLDNMRRADRQKKARLNAHKKGNHALCYAAVCEFLPGDVPGESSRGADRTGEDRIGKDIRVPHFTQEETVDPATGVVADWPSALIPDTEWGSPDAPGNVVRRAS